MHNEQNDCLRDGRFFLFPAKETLAFSAVSRYNKVINFMHFMRYCLCI